MTTGTKRRGRPPNQKLECVHQWVLDSTSKGTCGLCDAVWQFHPEGTEKPIILKEGRPARRRPGPARRRPVPALARNPSPVPESKFTAEERAQILEETEIRGVPVVAREREIPESTIYTWKARLKVKEQVELGFPGTLSLDRKGNEVRVYVRGELWATFTESTPYMKQLSHRLILDMVRRFLRHETLTSPDAKSEE